MDATNWIAIIGIAIINIGGLIGIYVNIKVKLKELEIKIISMEDKIKTEKETTDARIKDNQHAFHIHEAQNEKSNDKFEKKMDDIYKSINEVKSILMNK